jgi:hypothetical protein
MCFYRAVHSCHLPRTTSTSRCRDALGKYVAQSQPGFRMQSSKDGFLPLLNSDISVVAEDVNAEAWLTQSQPSVTRRLNLIFDHVCPPLYLTDTTIDASVQRARSSATRPGLYGYLVSLCMPRCVQYRHFSASAAHCNRECVIGVY